MTGLADLDGFQIIIQVCVWLGFPPLTMVDRWSLLHHFLFMDVFALLVFSFEHQNVITNKV